MDGLDFKAKLGPLPVWGWGIVVAGIVLIGYLMFKRGGSASGSPTASNLDAMGYQTAGIKGGSASDDIPPADIGETNPEWIRRASKLVADRSGVSSVLVYNALYKFVTGQALTTKEKSWVDAAISMAGMPPDMTQGVSDILPDKPVVDVDKPKPSPTPKPTVRRIDIPWGEGRIAVTARREYKQYVYDTRTGKAVRPISVAENRTLRAAGSKYVVSVVGDQRMREILKQSGLPQIIK